MLYICAGAALFIIPTLLLWKSTSWLVTLGIVFWIAYLWLYLRLIRWRAPSWMISAPSFRLVRWHAPRWMVSAPRRTH